MKIIAQTRPKCCYTCFPVRNKWRLKTIQTLHVSLLAFEMKFKLMQGESTHSDPGFQILDSDLTQHRQSTASQPASQPASHSATHLTSPLIHVSSLSQCTVPEAANRVLHGVNAVAHRHAPRGRLLSAPSLDLIDCRRGEVRASNSNHAGWGGTVEKHDTFRLLVWLAWRKKTNSRSPRLETDGRFVSRPEKEK
jgi:hypothetical protein